MFKGLVYLQVSSEEVPQGELRSQVLVNSAHCIHGSPPLPNNGDFCNAGNKRYYEGESWIDEDDKCISCTCKVTWRELLLTKNRDIFRGYSQEFLMGVWRPVLQITTLSVIKKMRFSIPVFGLDHIHFRFRTWLLKVVLCLRTHFLVQVKLSFVKAFFCYLVVADTLQICLHAVVVPLKNTPDFRPVWYRTDKFGYINQFDGQWWSEIAEFWSIGNAQTSVFLIPLVRWRTSDPGLLPRNLGREKHWGWVRLATSYKSTSRVS